MKTIVPLSASNGAQFYVEVEDSEADNWVARSEPRSPLSDQPEGSELTSAAGDAFEAMSSLQEGLRDVIAKIHSALTDSAPSSWKLELNVGFKGKTSPIPVLLSGEANATLKLQLEWKR
ncbi:MULTISPECIES: CU044_2847 family protein [Bradyrhizobium]|uniref:CU044_2847 family protein n=1 Tax=Bradyrhizobium TaxID=374 RepID=UPI00155E3A60|nr:MULTISPECIES: CU044_2847 family protein [Bradyrhizobium]MDD1517934.1 hypothetical protein [Bradyrhizobium sp. WBAH30]MDD1540719.1 hypothetical protein [Bradyrhizobium sp. WBAH41]MDD1555835.1 hypothetical protein [Bradyrhizobium sp. WBAH23]MDD1563354.1 hypothetical protein [Bradyrhizobium sp. WBAH33]MDD1588143.1 hypothetical protein [Bradyrhizobium sp. WBAH42]